MKNLIFVFIGGGFGSVLRFLVGKWFNNESGNFPIGTFIANVLGSLFIGLILGYAAKTDSLSNSQTLLLATGFCGGFTTFSSFAYENHMLIKSGDFLTFTLYTITSFVIGFLAVFAGLYLTK